MRKRFMVIDPGPMSTPARCVREVDLGNLPEYVTVDGHRFKRTGLHPKYHETRDAALSDAAKRCVRDVGAPGGIRREELRKMSAEERADIRDMKADARRRYGHLIRK